MKACLTTTLGVLFAANFLALGASSGSAGPRDEETGILISLSSSADSGKPGDTIVIRSSVQNTRNIPVLRPVDCTGGGVLLELLDPKGQVVCPVKYCDRLPLCPSREEEFQSGVLETSLEFDGILWEKGKGIPASSGMYTVRASFVYRVPGEQQILKREETTFFWNAE